MPSAGALAQDNASTPGVCPTFEPLEFPCSLGQEQYWILSQLDAKNPALTIAGRWRLQGRIDAAKLEGAFRFVVARHEILRTGFFERNGQPMQRVAPAVDFHLAVVDLSQLPEAARMPEAMRIGASEGRRPFDPAVPPMLRGTLIMLTASDAVLVVTMHHLVFDGWSMGILARDIGESYQALLQHQKPVLPELVLQYGDFSLWQRACQESEAYAAARAYWKQKLLGMKRFDMATDFPRPEVQTSNGAIDSLLLPGTLTDRLAEFGQRHGATMFVIALTALAGLLHRISGATDIGLGTQIAGRDQVELEDMIGVFISTLVLRIDASADPTMMGLLERVQVLLHEALLHSTVPQGRGTRYSVNFILHRSYVVPTTYREFSLDGLPSHATGALYDLNFFMVEWSNGWRISCEYNTDLFDPATIQSFLQSWRAILTAMPDQVDLRLSRLPLPDSATRRVLAARPAGGTIEAARDGRADAAVRPPGNPLNAAPTTETIQTVARIWRTILDVEDVDPDVSFFDLGGHSLLLLQMLGAVQAEFGERPQISALFRNPTVRGLAGLLGMRREAAVGPGPRREAFAELELAKWQPDGAGPPIIGLNDFGAFYTLAQAIGQNQPFVSISVANGELARPLPDQSLQEIAAEYARLIQQSQPSGRCFLMGWCLSGVLALEVARQLRADGREVPLVVLVDSWRPRYWKSLPTYRRLLGKLTHSWKWHMTELRSGRQNLRQLLLRNQHLRWLAKLRVFGKSLRGRAGLQESPYEWFISYMHDRVFRYGPTPYDGPVLIFRSGDEPSGRFLDPAFGWGELIPGLIGVQEVAGNHLSVFQKPGVMMMASRIRDELARAGAARPTDQNVSG